MRIGLGLGLTRGGGGALTGIVFIPVLVGPALGMQGVHFAATGLGTLDQRDMVVEWDYGDDYQFRYIPSTIPNVPEAVLANVRQSGTSIGHFGAHVYQEAGTYTVTCRARLFNSDGTITTVSTTQDVVITEDDVPNIIEEVAISLTGDFTDAPAVRTEVDWSVSGPPSSYTFQPGKRYHLEAGQDFNIPDGTFLDWPGSDTICFITRYGSGPNPTVIVNQGSDGLRIAGLNGAGQVGISGVDWNGGWDVNLNPDWEDTNEYPSPPPKPGDGISMLNLGSDAQNPQLLVFGSKISGFGNGFYPSVVPVPVTGAPSYNMLVDCEVTNWWNFPILGGSSGVSKSGYAGNYVHQKIGTQPLPQQQVAGTQGNWNNPGRLNTARHCTRLNSANNNATIKNVMIVERTGWSISGEGALIAAPQPAIRWQADPLTSAGFRATLAQNILIGGYNVMTSMNASGSNQDFDSGCAIMEFNFVLPNEGRTQAFVAHSKPGLHIRGNTFYWPADEVVTYNSQRYVVKKEGFIAAAATLDAHFYANTVIVDGDTSDDTWTLIDQLAREDPAEGANPGPLAHVNANNIIQINGDFDSAGSDAAVLIDYGPIEQSYPFRPKFSSIAYGAYTEGKLTPITPDGTLRSQPFSLGATEESGQAVVTLAIDQAEIASGDELGTDVTSTATIAFAGTGTPLTVGDITYNWTVNGVEQSDGFTISGTDVVRARASFTHEGVAQVVLSLPLTAPATGVAAPTLTGSPTLLASWDFSDVSKITLNGSKVASITGSDGTSVTLAQSTDAQRPTLIDVAGGYKAAQFASANSQILEAANGLGGPTQDMTLVLVARPTAKPPAVSRIGALIAKRAAAGTGREHKGIWLRGGAGDKWEAVNSGTTANNNGAGNGNGSLTTDRTLVISVAGALTNGAILYVNGQGTPATAPVSGIDGSNSYDVVRLGGDSVGYSDMEVLRAFVYAGTFTGTQAEEMAAWSATNYGTPNDA